MIGSCLRLRTCAARWPRARSCSSSPCWRPASSVGALWAASPASCGTTATCPRSSRTLLLAFVAARSSAFGLPKTWLLLAPRAGRVNTNQVSEPLAADSPLPDDHVVRQRVPRQCRSSRWCSPSSSRFVLSRRSSASGCGCSAATRGRRRRVPASPTVATAARRCWCPARVRRSRRWHAGSRRSRRPVHHASISSNFGWQGLLGRPGRPPACARRDPVAFVFARCAPGPASCARPGVERASPTSCRGCSCSPCCCRRDPLHPRAPAGRGRHEQAGRRRWRHVWSSAPRGHRHHDDSPTSATFRLVVAARSPPRRVDRREGRHHQHLARGDAAGRRVRRGSAVDITHVWVGLLFAADRRADRRRRPGQHEPPPAGRPVRRRAGAQRARARAGRLPHA